MKNKFDLTKGSIVKNLLKFSVPYLISCFLQTFYGLADLYITGQYNGAAAISAVSIGSQVMHMITVIIVGFAMGTTVLISNYIGAKKRDMVKDTIGNSIVFFAVIATIMTVSLLVFTDCIIKYLAVPVEAVAGTKQYLLVCFVGVVFITSYNVICSIFRGLGNSITPMYFVAIAGVINIGLDYLFIGQFKLAAFGAALATVISQALSVIMALFYSINKVPEIRINKANLRIKRELAGNLLKIGFPVAMQDGLIQIAFLVITIIANMRGVEVAAAVGIVEKLIGFMFLVPSAMLSAVSTITAANIGANTPRRGKKTLYCGIGVCLISGLIFTIICLIDAENILRLFANEEETVILMGAQYLRSYVFDCLIAGVHFCFSGYFCAYNKSWISFVHNIISIVVMRIPGAYFASVMYPETLLPMGMAAPLGSLLSAIICVIAYIIINKKTDNYSKQYNL